MIKNAIACYASALLLAVAGLLMGLTTATADEPDLKAVKEALSKYKDPYVAVRDLYLSTVGCVHYDGSSEPGHLNYPKGAMGVHFVNLTIQGPLDPMKPNVLIYEPKDGKLHLVAAEWLVPLKAAPEHPTLFGQKFQGPMEGHEPLIPGDFHHYDLHVWLFKDNPEGMFAPTNPNVSCTEADFQLLEKPTKLVEAP